jgi:hypothetical protein
MHSVSVNLSITYAKSNLSPAEKHPQVRCFLDARFDREPVTIQLDKEGKTYQTCVQGKLVGNHSSIPPTTALCLASMAWRTNDVGSPCLLDTGVTHVTFGEIAQGILSQGSFEKDMHLVMYTAQGLDKGMIRLKVTGISGVKIKDPSIIGHQLCTERETIPLITAYINDTIGAEQRMRDTFHGTENMRIPFDYSESGIQTTLGTPLPAAAFVMSETPKTNALYWENAFQTIMRRDNLEPQQWNRLNLAGKARATVLTICYAAQYMDYVSDTVDRNTRIKEYSKQLVLPYENFGNALAMNSGDCEDLAAVELQCYNALQSLDTAHCSAELKELKQIAGQYVPPLSLDVVRGAQVADRVEHYGAHMNDNFVPIQTFCKWMDKTREGRQTLKTLPLPEQIQEDLPFLVGEGTGMYEPYGYDNPLRPLMGYVYQARSLSAFKKPILHKKGEPGSFFVGSLVGMTDYFYKRGQTAPMSFWYCTKQKNGELTRGVSYNDMMNDSDRVCVKVQPLLSQQIMGTVEEAVLRRIPPNSLHLSSLDAPASRKQHSVLDRVSRAVSDMRRPSGGAHQKVPVYVRPHQLNAQVGAAMIADFQRMERIWKVDYELEQITDKLWGYRMEIYVN